MPEPSRSNIVCFAKNLSRDPVLLRREIQEFLDLIEADKVHAMDVQTTGDYSLQLIILAEGARTRMG